MTAATASGDRFVVTFKGRWDVQTVMAHERELIAMKAVPGRPSIIDVSGVDQLDTVGAIAISRIRDRLSDRATAEIVGVHPAQAALLDEVCRADSRLIPAPPPVTTADRVATLGRWTIGLWHEAGELLSFFGELCVVIVRLVREPSRLRMISTTHHMQMVGINAMPIVGLLGFLIGIVLTFISGDELQQFGAGIFIVNLLGIGVLREIGILITAIIVAGRSGSAFTAEIGTMKINQEVDAMRTIGLDPMEVLVVPRTLALMLMLIPLGFFADVLMIAGGALMADLTLDITFPEFIAQFRSAIGLRQLWIGMIETPFFAFVIAMVGCYHGLAVSGSAESVGRHTTQSVVWSIFLVIVIEAIFSVMFWRLGW